MAVLTASLPIATALLARSLDLFAYVYVIIYYVIISRVIHI